MAAAAASASRPVAVTSSTGTAAPVGGRRGQDAATNGRIAGGPVTGG